MNCDLVSYKNSQTCSQIYSLEISPDWVLFAAELEFPKILVPRLPQYKLEMCRKLRTTLFFLCDQFLVALIHLNMFLINDALCKLCNIWLLLCKNNSRSITILELSTGGKYCCSYYLRHADRWQFGKANWKQNFLFLLT